MRVTPGRLAGILVVEPQVVVDGRGFFVETYQRSAYEAAGVDADFVQDNHSRSIRNTIRGLHYQSGAGQPKLVRVAHGAAFDVVVDIRPSSRTFGEWESFQLDDETHRQVYIPPGFAHGFCALTETVDFAYKVGTYYDRAAERGIAWDDPAIAIPWPTSTPIVSDRDRRNPMLREIQAGQDAPGTP